MSSCLLHPLAGADVIWRIEWREKENEGERNGEGKSYLKHKPFATHLYCLDIHSWAPDPLPPSLNPAEDKLSTSLCVINRPFNITRSFPSNDHLHLPYGHQLFLTCRHQPLFIMGRCNKPKISANIFLIHCVIFDFPSALYGYPTRLSAFWGTVYISDPIYVASSWNALNYYVILCYVFLY